MAVKKNLKNLETLVDRVRRAFLRDAEKNIKEIIINDNIAKGLSPVNGEGKFQKYSDSYKDAIKKGRYSKFGKTISPVNLKLSGDFHDSFKVKQKLSGINISFQSKLADIHNRQGAGKSKTVRRILPTEQGEEFKKSVIDKIIDLLRGTVDKEVKK